MHIPDVPRERHERSADDPRAQQPTRPVYKLQLPTAYTGNVPASEALANI